ncbi:hypothetical protein LTR85_011225 [Meristemomyces frigidus]|nr:hypothetical protein LTR85_011225 [Meristemomyces frigidus]
MHILGVCNGQVHGNSEILLKAALTEAISIDPSITTSRIHAPSLIIPRNPAPLKGAMDVSLGTNKGQMSGSNTAESKVEPDDRQAALNAILDADAIIVSSATYSHQPPGFLKVLLDRIGGPYLDAGFVHNALVKQRAGDPLFANFTYDPRLLKPRVLGFMMTGGSTTPDQFSMALLEKNFMDAGSVLLDVNVMERARLLARNTVSQLGKGFDDAVYLGPEEAGACPYCHLTTIELFHDGANGVGCMTCGARGKLVVVKQKAGADGGGDDSPRILPEWEADSEWSCITLRGKIKHAEEILSWGSRESGKMAGVQEEKEKWVRTEVPLVSLPSTSRS